MEGREVNLGFIKLRFFKRLFFFAIVKFIFEKDLGSIVREGR